SFTLETASEINLAIYNIKGQRVAELADGEKPAGTYNVTWNGDDNSGSALPAGVYFYQLKSGNSQENNKLLLIR
ncbi:MAG: FlgD immunoglobulin-like domain containing protein, partial [Candidatus Stygibacter australis]|nr:FlgD immunoglobulin-like domain containing protein [Candidatus Stygibacter australis]